MKIILTIVLSIVVALLGSPLAFAGDEQAELDQACEVAREKKLAPEREKYIEECVANEQQPDRAACERYYADYGNKSGNRAPLYYDLPECVKAFEYRNAD